MAAVVEDDEHPHGQCACENRQGNGDPPRDALGEIHRDPQSDERDDGVDHLPCGAANAGFLVARHDLFPLGSIRLRCSIG